MMLIFFSFVGFLNKIVPVRGTMVCKTSKKGRKITTTLLVFLE